MRHIALVSRTGAGKGTFIEYVSETHGYKSISFSGLIEGIARMRGLLLPGEAGIGRDRKMEVSNIMAKGEPNYLAAEIVRVVNSDPASHYVIDGVRRQEELDTLRAGLGRSLLVYAISAGYGSRERRVMERDGKGVEYFKKLDDNDTALGIDGLMAQADFTVSNDGTMEQFVADIKNKIPDALM